MILENLEKVRALLEKFLLPGSLFSCNSESYVRELDKIRVSDKNSTKKKKSSSYYSVLRSLWGLFCFFTHWHRKAAFALSWPLVECHGICTAKAKSHLGWLQSGFTPICGNVDGCTFQAAVLTALLQSNTKA